MRRALLVFFGACSGGDGGGVDAPRSTYDGPPPVVADAPAIVIDARHPADPPPDAPLGSVDATPPPDAPLVTIDARPAADAPPPVDAPPTSGFSETFSVANAAAWPAPWVHLGGAFVQTVAGNRGRLVPITSDYALARMGVDGAWRDAEVTFDVSFEEIGTQGVGFYLRQNGGWLRNSATHGQGYAAFLEGFRGSRFGVWREVDGVEQELAFTTDFATPLASSTLYRVRFRVTQATASATRLQARVWPAAGAEPSTWSVDVQDATAVLQNVADGLAVDSYSSVASGQVTAGATVDNIVLTPL